MVQICLTTLRQGQGAPITSSKSPGTEDTEIQVLKPSLSHRVYTTVGIAWPVFGFLFLTLLCGTCWFSLEPLYIFPFFAFFCLVVGHALAVLLESKVVTRAVRFFKHGQPLIYFNRFLSLELEKVGSASDDVRLKAIVLGQRRVLISSVSELYLTFLGTLEVRSLAVCGDNTSLMGGRPVPDVVARLPLSTVDLEKQKQLIRLFELSCPGLIVNKRLKDRLDSPVVKGQMFLQLMGAAVITFALFDVAYATSAWLTMLRAHYGAQLLLRNVDIAEREFFRKGKAESDSKKLALALYESAEAVREHPFPLSWAYKALFSNHNSQAQLAAMRAETLFRLGRLKESLKLMEEAIAGSPSGYKNQLIYARYLYEDGQADKARAVLNEVLEKHKDVLMPRIYDLALVTGDNAVAEQHKIYDESMKVLDEQVFGPEPAWPPGGERPIMEMWRRDDLEFLSRRLLFPKAGKPGI